ncbi:MAG: class I SAM-dependent methyltransferase [Clostridia bacterium]|nr:class I SAM-dependent methyltransferase [Clostridia bacterium]MBQ6961813.1 class I SAM-dependent methyltransferase [Clostridia bacterium]
MENLTAKVSCFARAYHCKNSAVPIFADTAAEGLLGLDYDQIAQSMRQGMDFFLPDFHGGAEEGLRLIVDRQLSPSVLGRSAYCERALKNEQRFGCRQYVLFAAGYDTFAIRNRDPFLEVFELDLPDVLADKEKRIRQAGMKSKAGSIPCNLAEASWKDRLIAGGFDRGAKAFGSLLGISYYLDKGAFQNLLNGIGEIFSEGSALCFDYPLKEGSAETRANRELARGAGERMKARYTEREMESMLAACGFLIYEHADHKDMTHRFFADYNAANPAHRMEAPKGVCYTLAVRKG